MIVAGRAEGMARGVGDGRPGLDRVRAMLAEGGALWAFTAIWAVGIVLPLAGGILFSFLGGNGIKVDWTPSLDAYRDIILTGRWQVMLRTVWMALAVTATCLAIGFPFALWLAKRARHRALVEAIWMALTVPFFLDPSARTLVWRSVLGSTGLVNAGLMKLGLTDQPVEWLLFSDFAVYFGMVGPYFPNMVWPLYLAILLIPDDLIQASRDLGAGPREVLRDVILPLALPGIVAGTLFTFIPVLGDTIATTLLGGGKTQYLADSIASLVKSLNYAGAAAFATLILALAAGLVAAGALARRRRLGLAA